MAKYLSANTPAPWFEARSPINPRFQFNTVAGRFVLLSFFGSTAESRGAALWTEVNRRRHEFDDERLAFFGVSIDPQDERQSRVVENLPGIHLFWDFDQQVSRRYGVAISTRDDSAATEYFPCTYVLDERLRIVAVVPLGSNAEQHLATVLQHVAGLPPLGSAHATLQTAPLLIVPRVFEPALCLALIEYFESHGGQESGFMRDIHGQTVLVHDHGHKRRRDCEIVDASLRKACMVRIHDCLAPEIRRAFQFSATRIERYIVACYDSSTGGHFQAHRDNTTLGTAHRQFAVSLNLNSEEYEGGDLRFPEFGRATYRAPTGGAVVFSCSLLHEAAPVAAGKRYAFLPFLYDDAAAQLRAANLQHISTQVVPKESSA
jgi:peroxiredoxin